MTRCQILLISLLGAVSIAQTPASNEVETVYPDAHALYLDLHEHPELSIHETKLPRSWPLTCAAPAMTSLSTLAGLGRSPF